jgi:hypothetical protein
MQTTDTIADAITRSRLCDEIVAVIVTDIHGAIKEAERIGAVAKERTDWAEDVARENGAAVVSIWGWDETTADQDHSAWRIEIVARA